MTSFQNSFQKLTALAGTITALTCLIAAGPSGTENEAYQTGYKEGQRIGAKHCAHPLVYGIPPTALCGYNEHPSDADQSTLDWIDGCINGYTKTYPLCGSDT